MINTAAVPLVGSANMTSLLLPQSPYIIRPGENRGVGPRDGGGGGALLHIPQTPPPPTPPPDPPPPPPPALPVLLSPLLHISLLSVPGSTLLASGFFCNNENCKQCAHTFGGGAYFLPWTVFQRVFRSLFWSFYKGFNASVPGGGATLIFLSRMCEYGLENKRILKGIK